MIESINSLPDSGDFSGESIKWDILNLAARIKSNQTLEGIDLSNSMHLKPYSVACLAGIGAYCKDVNQAPLQIVVPSNQECYEHLSRLGFFKYFNHQYTVLPQRKTNVPIEQLFDLNRVGDFAHKAISVWAGQIDDCLVNIPSELQNLLDEIIRNAVTHSESPIGCIVVGQALPESKYVDISVVDFGQTIRSHLKLNPKYSCIASDAEAILKATEEAVTGTVGLNKFGEPNSGEGLSQLRNFCEQGLGILSILSGDCYIVFAPKSEPQIVNFYRGFQGCLVNVRFFVNKPLTLDDTNRILWQD